MGMDKLSSKNRSRTWLPFLYIVIMIVFFHMLCSVVGDGGQYNAHEMQKKPVFAKVVKDALSTFKKSHKNYWDKLKTVIHQVQLKYFPPDLDFRRQDQEVDSKSKGAKNNVGAGERVKEAAEKSFEASKMTAEESAKSAAKAVGEAVNKVKDTVSDDNSHDEL